MHVQHTAIYAHVSTKERAGAQQNLYTSLGLAICLPGSIHNQVPQMQIHYILKSLLLTMLFWLLYSTAIARE